MANLKTNPRCSKNPEVMALNVGVICGMVAAAGLGALVVQAALITGTA